MITRILSLLLVFTFITLSASIAQEKNLVAVGIARNDHVYYWWRDKNEYNDVFTVNSATTDFSKVYFAHKLFHKLLNPLVHDRLL